MTKPKKSRKRFTLVELLVVVAIIGVVMALVLPAFNRMISGNKVDQWTGNLKLAIDQARSLAASRRAPAGVVIVNNGTDYPKKTAYRLVQKENGVWKWASDSSWKVMEGAVLVRIKDSDIASTDIPNAGGALSDTALLRAFSPLSFSGVEFGSNGSLIGAVELHFAVAEGELDGSGNIIYTAPNSADKTDNLLKLKLNGLTGRVEYMP